MTAKNCDKIIKFLIKRYGKEIPTYLFYHKNKPYEFLFAVMMSAQCTDKRVNIVTKDLYKKYTSLKSFATARLSVLEKDIHSVGFYHNKAKNIIKCAKKLISDYDGKVPNDFDELISLPGVGRKTASVVISRLYNIPAMAVDTHVYRVSKKFLGIKCKNVREMEEKLKEIVPKKYWEMWNTHIIAFGREICTSRNPKCEVCELSPICHK